MTPRIASLFPILLGLTLSACGGGNSQPQLMTFKTTKEGPDEFLVVPAKPLQTPPSSSELPVPTPGATNLTDPTPRADAVAALGGNPAALGQTTIPAADGALVAYAGRDGVDPEIRQTTAIEDLETRRENRGKPLERLAGMNTYYNAYRDESLDQQAEMERFRRANIPTPSAPPAELKPR